jgi:hypothetical protein
MTTSLSDKAPAEMIPDMPSSDPKVLGYSPPPQNASAPPKHRGFRPQDDGYGGLNGDPSIAQKAAEGARAAREAGAHYRRDFSSAEYWNELAAERGIRLPQWHIGPTKTTIRRWLKTLGISVDQYREWSGLELDGFAKYNPDWPMRALLGDILEWNRDEWIAKGRSAPGHKQA